MYKRLLIALCILMSTAIHAEIIEIDNIGGAGSQGRRGERRQKDDNGSHPSSPIVNPVPIGIHPAAPVNPTANSESLLNQ